MKDILTRDHFTPRSIAKVLGWSHKQIVHPDNIQYLSWKEHRDKDQTTPWELAVVKRNGGAKTLWEHHNELVILRKGMPAEATTAAQNAAGKARGESVRKLWQGQTLRFEYHEFSNHAPVDRIISEAGAVGQQELPLYGHHLISVFIPQHE